MRVVESELLRVTDTSSPVLLLGETGVGKEVAARQLHHTSARRDLPFIVVSCATIPVDRAESEMFGHERGGVAGSRTAHVGLVDQAGGGTLFLDEVAALPSSLQGKLLRLLEDGSYRRLGGAQGLCPGARIVSSTAPICRHWWRREVSGRFMHHRLNVIQLHIPPLRARRRTSFLSRSTILRNSLAARNPPSVFDTGCAGGLPTLIGRKRPGCMSARACGWPVGRRATSRQAIFPEQVANQPRSVSQTSPRRASGRASTHEEAISQTNGEIAKRRPARHLPYDPLGRCRLSL
jgi:hypothetical protein